VRNLIFGETHPPGPRSDLAAAEASSLVVLVRQHDHDRYQTALFGQSVRREALLALYAFNYEIARVRETVTQPMLGHIRLQWWREVLDAAYAGAPARQHPVTVPLSAAIREFGLRREPFDRLVDSRERDLIDDPPASLAALEDYAEGTSAPLVHLALQVLGAPQGPVDETARQVGIGYALAGLLRAMPFHARSGRRYIPADIAERGGLDPADYAAGRSTPALRAAVHEIAEAAAQHLRAARNRHAAIPRSAIAALLPATVADRFLARLQRAEYDPFAPSLAMPDPLQIWHLAAAALLNRF
jgi:NADH dehydrogenase [ubiquinone] 1 alpha subcomplex assembly factor 6